MMYNNGYITEKKMKNWIWKSLNTLNLTHLWFSRRRFPHEYWLARFFFSKYRIWLDSALTFTELFLLNMLTVMRNKPTHFIAHLIDSSIISILFLEHLRPTMHDFHLRADLGCLFHIRWTQIVNNINTFLPRSMRISHPIMISVYSFS